MLMNKIKVAALVFVAAGATAIGTSGMSYGQYVPFPGGFPTPVPGTPVPGTPVSPGVPSGETPGTPAPAPADPLRSRFATLASELAYYLADAQVQERVNALEKEVAVAKAAAERR